MPAWNSRCPNNRTTRTRFRISRHETGVRGLVKVPPSIETIRERMKWKLILDGDKSLARNLLGIVWF